MDAKELLKEKTSARRVIYQVLNEGSIYDIYTRRRTSCMVVARAYLMMPFQTHRRADLFPFVFGISQEAISTDSAQSSLKVDCAIRPLCMYDLMMQEPITEGFKDHACTATYLGSLSFSFSRLQCEGHSVQDCLQQYNAQQKSSAQNPCIVTQFFYFDPNSPKGPKGFDKYQIRSITLEENNPFNLS